MFVAESIEDVLKPRPREDIDKDIDLIIDKFVDKVTLKDFLKSFYNIRSWSDDSFRGMRNFKQGNKHIFVMNKDVFYHIIDDLASAFKFDEPLMSDIDARIERREHEDSYKFPEFHDFWMDFNMQTQMSGSNYNYVLDRLMEKLATKFNVEYE